jgi:hypothetical protein
MADPNKYKSVSVNIKAYNALSYLTGKLTNADLSISKVIEHLAIKNARSKGYRNGKQNT